MYNLLLKNRIFNSAILVILLILLRVIHFFDPVLDYNGPAGFLYHTGWVEAGISTGGWIWTTIMLLVQMFTIILICLQLKISSESTLVPGLVFVLLTTLIPEFGTYQPLIFANTFLLMALLQLFMITPRQPSGKQIFNAGIWIAIAALFYISYAFFFIAIVSGINIIRSYRFKDIKVLFLGFLMPFFLLGVYSFWRDRLPEFAAMVFEDLGLLTFRYMDNWFHIAVFVFLILLVVSMILNVAQVMNKKINQKQNYFKILYWFLVSCLFMTIFQRNLGVEHLLVLVVPLSIICSEYLVNWKAFNAKVFVNVLLVMIILYQFKDLVLNAT